MQECSTWLSASSANRVLASQAKVAKIRSRVFKRALKATFELVAFGDRVMQDPSLQTWAESADFSATTVPCTVVHNAVYHLPHQYLMF